MGNRTSKHDKRKKHSRREVVGRNQGHLSNSYIRQTTRKPDQTAENYSGILREIPPGIPPDIGNVTSDNDISQRFDQDDEEHIYASINSNSVQSYETYKNRELPSPIPQMPPPLPCPPPGTDNGYLSPLSIKDDPFQLTTTPEPTSPSIVLDLPSQSTALAPSQNASEPCQSGAPRVKNKSDTLEILKLYGFHEQKCKEAMELCDNDLIQTISYLHNTRSRNFNSVRVVLKQERSTFAVFNEQMDTQHFEPPVTETSPTCASPSSVIEELEILVQHSDLVVNQEPFQCQICEKNIPPGEGAVLKECIHNICQACLRSAASNTTEPYVQCPFVAPEDGTRCTMNLQDREICALLGKPDFDNHLRRRLTVTELKTERSFHCKAVDCEGWCIVEGRLKVFLCPVCKGTNCMVCGRIHQDGSLMCP